MGIERFDSWDLGTGSHGVLGEVDGIVQVDASVRERAVGEKDGREIFSMPIPDALLTDVIKGALFYSGYLEHVAEYQRYLDAECNPKEEEPSISIYLSEAHSISTESSGNAESPSIDVELTMTDSVTESDEEVAEINVGDQDEGPARPNPGEHDEGQAGSNPGDAAESQPQSSHVVHAGPNLKHIDLEAIDASTQQNPEQMDEEFTTTAYPNVDAGVREMAVGEKGVLARKAVTG
nr:hypothetical protein [Tanacetum cinerariifolium]